MKFKFVKGDPDRLLGKVTVYCRYICHGVNYDCKHFQDCSGCNALTPPGSLIGKYAITKGYKTIHEVKDPRINREKSRIADLLKIPSVRDRILRIPIYESKIFNITSEDELITSDSDVIFIDEFNYYVRAYESLNMAVNFYFVGFEEQININHSLMPDSGIDKGRSLASSSGTRQKPGREYTHVSQLEQGALEDYITDNFIIPMMTASARKDTVMIDDLSYKLKRFTEGSYFDRDAHDLAEIIKSCGPSPDAKLIAAFARKIGAIDREEYELAGEQLRIITGIIDKNKEEPNSRALSGK